MSDWTTSAQRLEATARTVLDREVPPEALESPLLAFEQVSPTPRLPEGVSVGYGLSMASLYATAKTILDSGLDISALAGPLEAVDRERLLIDARKYKYSEDVPLNVPLEVARVAFWQTLCDADAPRDPELPHFSTNYIREKSTRIYQASEWWHVRNLLHRALFSRFYQYIDDLTNREHHQTLQILRLLDFQPHLLETE